MYKDKQQIMNKKKQKKFQLFTHDEIELKNAFITEARELANSERFSGKLASAMIYVSLAEYLAEHLLENLNYLVYRSSYVDYGAILYIDERSISEKQTLGQSTRNLAKYSFPDKSSIIKTLEKITKSRNHLFHNLAKTSFEDWSKLEEDITDISNNVEELIEKINIVTEGLRKIFVPQPEASEDAPAPTNSK